MNTDVLINMNTAKRCLAIALLLLLVGSTAGCFDEVVKPEYDGPPKVQFDPTSGTVADGAGVVPISILLIAPHQPDDSQFPITVVDTGNVATTADGFQLLTETATIPADSSFGEVRVRVDSAGIAPGESEIVTLALEDSENGEIVPATNFRFFTLQIVGRAANVAADPAPLGFGEVATDSTAQDTVTVTNTLSGLEGNTSTDISNLAITGADADVFSIASPAEDSFTLPSDGSMDVIVEFAPVDTVAYEAALEFDFTNDPDAEEASVELTGTGMPANGALP